MGVVADALRLRRWALRCLVGEVVDAPASCPTAFRIFLEAERCGVILQRYLHGSVARPSFPEEAERLVAERCASEERRIRSAEKQLAIVGDIARAGGWRVVVLRGGVLTGTADAVDLVDIDLLTHPEDARVFAAALDRHGYRSVGEGTARHLDTRSIGQPVGIEIHTALDRHGVAVPGGYWDRLVPHGSFDGLLRLGHSDHLWTVLEHATRNHPERRGNIRDLVVIGYATAECTAEDLEDVHRRMAVHPLATELQDTLLLARALNGGRFTEDDLALASAVRYAVRVLLESVPMPPGLEGYVYGWTFALLFGTAERKDMWGDVFAKSIEVSSHRHVRWLERRAQRVGRIYRVAVRLARAAVALVGAVPTALLAGSIARRAMRTVAFR